MKVTASCGIITMSTEVAGIKFLSTGKSPKEACIRLACKLVKYIQNKCLGSMDVVKDYMELLREYTGGPAVAIAKGILEENFKKAINDGFLVDFGVKSKDLNHKGIAYTGENISELVDLLCACEEGDTMYVTVRKYADKDRQMYLLGMFFECGAGSLSEKMVLNVVSDDLDFRVNGCCALEVKKKAWGKIMEHLVEHNLRMEEE